MSSFSVRLSRFPVLLFLVLCFRRMGSSPTCFEQTRAGDRKQDSKTIPPARPKLRTGGRVRPFATTKKNARARLLMTPSTPGDRFTFLAIAVCRNTWLIFIETCPNLVKIVEKQPRPCPNILAAAAAATATAATFRNGP